MDLGKVVVKNFEREDVEGMKAFAEVLNSRDGIEVSVPEQAIQFILSNEEFRKSIFIVHLGDEQIGFAGCMPNISKPENANFQIMVHPDYRRQGLGGMLYSKILERAKNTGVKSINAFAKERLKQSVDFLQKRGFVPEKYSWKMDLQLSKVDRKEIPADCNIRRITIDDHNDYIGIMNAGFKPDGKDPYTEKSFEMNLKNPDEYIFFVEQDGKIVSTAAIGMEKDLSRGYIYNVTVYSQYRGKGFGEVTINHCINVIKEANLGKATLNVYGENKNALNLYKKVGFIEADTDITFKGEI